MATRHELDPEIVTEQTLAAGAEIGTVHSWCCF